MTFLLSVVLLCASFQAQSLVQLQGQLQSGDPQERAKAFEALLALPKAVKDPALTKVLVDLLDRENGLIEATLRESHEQVGVSRKYGDAYGDYVDDLRDTVAEVADLHDPRVIKVLMMSSFAPDSVFGRNLAVLGDALIAPLLERAASDLEIERSVAFEMFGIVVDANRGRLPAAAMTSIKKVLIAGVKDHGVRARYMAVHALGFAGDASDIPLLQEVSKTDPEVYEGGPAPRYVVRDEAVKSIQRIRDRGPDLY